MSAIHLYTIGFTKTSAEAFFTTLREAGVKRLIDVRLNNSSQLAGFAKKDDLAFFLRKLCQIEYVHRAELAPTQDILDDFKKHNGDWSVYVERFLALMQERQIETMDPAGFHQACLLCSEDTPDHCHRRLVAEYLRDKWGSVEIEHLLPSRRCVSPRRRHLASGRTKQG